LRKKLYLLAAFAIFLLAISLVLSTTSQQIHAEITDDLGRAVSIEKKPERIVSLAPSCTEILYALGLGDKVVGVTTYCDYPPEALSVTKVGGPANVDVEKVISLQPDLVLASTITPPETIERLEELGVPVIVLDPKTIDDVYHDIELVGKATGKEAEAGELILSMKLKISQVEQKVSAQQTKVRVLYICWLEPIYASGSNTFVNDAIAKAGGENVFAEKQGWIVVSPESVVAKNPDVIVFTSMMEFSYEDAIAKIESMPGWSEVNAVKSGRVYVITGSAASMIERPGPRIADGVEMLAKIFYPEVFGVEMPKHITG